MSTGAAPSRVVLVEEPSQAPGRIRRFRVARIQVNPQPRQRPQGEPFGHLKRAYD